MIRADITSQSDIDSALSQVKATGRNLYGIVNSAGIAPKGLPALKGITESETADISRLMDVNFLGAIRINKAFSTLVIASEGCIVNVSSLASKVPVAVFHYPAYPGLSEFIRDNPHS